MSIFDFESGISILEKTAWQSLKRNKNGHTSTTPGVGWSQFWSEVQTFAGTETVGFSQKGHKKEIESVSNLKVRYIYIYRICIYIYLHTYKYYLHTYTYYIYIFDIGGSESKTSRFGFLIQKGWACLLYCVRGGCWVLWYQWCELCKAVEGHAPCSQPCPNLYM